MKLILVRHGQTDINLERKLQGAKSDKSLNSTGVLQARGVRKVLKKENVDVLITSPLKRALETAEIINEKIKKNIILEDLAIERDFGELENYPVKEFIKDFRGKEEFYYFKYKSESRYALQERAYKLLHKLLNNYKGKTVILVSHAGLIKGILSVILDLPFNKIMEKIRVENCSITKINFQGNHPIILNINYWADVTTLTNDD